MREHARDLARRLGAQGLEVVGRDRPVARAQLERGAAAGIVERLAVDAARGRDRVGDGGHARDRRLEHREHPGGQVAAPAAAAAIPGHAHERALRRHLAVLAPGAVAGVHGRPQVHLAGGGVEQEVAVLRGALGEARDELPPLPRLGPGRQHLERLVAGERERRGVAQAERLAGGAVALAEQLGPAAGGVHRRDAGAERAGRDRVDLGRQRVGGGHVGPREGVDAAADPVRLAVAHRRHAGRGRELELDHAAAVVEAAGVVGEHRRLAPAQRPLAGRVLPPQRRVLGIDAGAAGLRALDRDADDEPGQRRVEAQVERIAGDGRSGERRLVAAARAGDARADRHLAGDAVVLDQVRLGAQGRDGEVGRRLEHDRLVAGRAHRADLGVPRGHGHRLDRRGGQPEAHLGGGRRGRRQRDPEQLEQGDVQLVGDAVQAVDEHVGHPGEELDQGDAGVGDVVLGPLRARARDPGAGLVHEILEAAVVELDLGQAHDSSSDGTR